MDTRKECHIYDVISFNQITGTMELLCPKCGRHRIVYSDHIETLVNGDSYVDHKAGHGIDIISIGIQSTDDTFWNNAISDMGLDTDVLD